MVKKKPSSKEPTSRKDTESERRADINAGIERVSNLVPYLRYTSSFSGPETKVTKNNKLRLTTMFVNLVTSEKYKNYWQNRNSSTEKLLEFFNIVRSEMKCSFFFADAEARILFTHGDVFEKLGYDAQDVIGNRIQDLLLPLDELNSFTSKLTEVKQKLLNKNGRSQYFEFTCHFLHQKRNKSSTQHRSQVIFYGNMFLSKESEPCHVKIKKQGNGHITIKEQNALEPAKPNHNDYPFFIFCQLQILPDELFRQSLLTVQRNEYVLFMRASGMIFYADQRMVKVLGRSPVEVIHSYAHTYIAQDDLRLALYAHLKLLKRQTDVGESVHRLLDRSNKLVYVRSLGVLYENDEETIFKLTAIKIDEDEGKARLEQELKLLPEDVKSCELDVLAGQVKEMAEKYNQKASNMELSQEQLNDAHLSSSCSASDSEFEVKTDNLVSNSQNYINPQQLIQPQCTNQPLSSYLTIAPPQLLINSFNNNHHQQQQQILLQQQQQQQNHQQQQLQQLQPGQLNSVSFNGYTQNQTQTTPITMSNPLVYRYIPATSLIATDETLFTPTMPNNNITTNQQQQIFVPSPQPLNDRVFIHNINININNNNFIMLNNNNQQLIGDHHLPTDGEGAFVNLIPFLEHDVAHTDLNASK